MDLLTLIWIGFIVCFGCFVVSAGLSDIGRGLHAIAKSMERK